MKIISQFKDTEIGRLPVDWEAVELGTTVDFQYGLGESAQPIGDYVYIRITDITPDGFLNNSGLVFIGKEKVNEKYLLKKGDVLVARTGASFGKTYLFKENIKASYGGFLIKILFNEKKMNPNFYFQFSRSKMYWDQANNLVGGGAQPQFNANVLCKIVVPLPLLTEQSAIAKILSDLDSKIELNNRMNKTLEAIGQAFFKHWFIEFEFPNEKGKPYKSSGGKMVDSELGEIPKGWQVKTINEIVTVRGGSTPSTSNKEYWENGKMNWCTPKDLSKISFPALLETERKITEKGLGVISSGLLPVGTLLLSSRAPIGYLAISEIPISINQGFIAILCDKGLSNYFMLYWTKLNIESIKSMAHGTTFDEINKASFKSIKIVVPPSNLLREYDKISKTFYLQLAAKERQSRTLSQIRDSLLPKLMSGKIRVPTEVAE